MSKKWLRASRMLWPVCPKDKLEFKFLSSPKLRNNYLHVVCLFGLISKQPLVHLWFGGPLVVLSKLMECFLFLYYFTFYMWVKVISDNNQCIKICNLHTTVPLINLVHSIVTGKSQTEALIYWPSDQGPGLRFPCNDWTVEFNKLFIIWPFHYGPEPEINLNQKLVSR